MATKSVEHSGKIRPRLAVVYETDRLIDLGAIGGLQGKSIVDGQEFLKTVP